MEKNQVLTAFGMLLGPVIIQAMYINYCNSLVSRYF